jgi:hypothetical protein
VFTLTVLIAAFFSGILLGRLAYLMSRDLKLGFPRLFGVADDSPADQVRMLIFSATATMAAADFAINEGVNYILPIILMPFLFSWSAEVILTWHRAFGAVIENCVLNFNPVDFCYALFKRSMTLMWTNSLSRSRNTNVAEVGDAEDRAKPAKAPPNGDYPRN